MNPEGNVILENIVLEGNNKNYVFASLKKNMSSLYNVKVKDCEISHFAYVLKAYKESFADSISFSNCIIADCENGIELSEETNDKGDYNAEFLTIENCTFKNVKANVIDYYRGGYDESTIGGNLKVRNSEFVNCGAGEKNGILLNTRGIINVAISDNIFRNNPVKLVALLWGAKNNTHSNNKIVNSGEIIVQENIKLSLMY
jgi:poly(beta-D-mannuronate) lyase